MRRRVASSIPSSYERLEDVVSRQLNLSDAINQADDIDDALERRLSFRCPIQLEESAALLFRDGKRQPWHLVRLIDQSAGGFSVSFNGEEEFEEGQVFMMQTKAGWHEVRIAYLASENGEMQIGLERLSDHPKKPGQLSARTVFLIVMFVSMSIFTFALMAR